MNKLALRSDILLLLTSLIWGFAFVAQRSGMEHLGPFAYNGIRFALGSISLLPLIALLGALRRRKDRGPGTTAVSSATSAVSATASDAGAPHPKTEDRKFFFPATFAAGSALFLGASLQQVGIIYTTAGKAGFITGMYVVLVPIAGIAFGHRTGAATWVGAVLAVVGLYVLSAAGNLAEVNPGDALVALSALFWTAHVLIIDHISKRLDPVKVASAQFAWCSIFSILVAFFTETVSLGSILAAAGPILYGGLASVGIAYTLQVVAQKDAPPAHSAIILCLEGVFATLGGILLLSEPMGARNVLGSALMLCGMIATQWELIRGKGSPAAAPSATAGE